MSRFAKRSAAGALLLVLAVAGVAHGASKARFVSLVPGPDRGSWSAVVEAKGGAKAIAKLSLRAGPDLVEPKIEELPGDRARLLFRDIPAGAQLLELGTEKKKGFAPSAAVRLSSLGEDRPGDWVIYHIMMGYFRNASSANDGKAGDPDQPELGRRRELGQPYGPRRVVTVQEADHEEVSRAALILLDHNSYHAGQLIALRRALGAWPG